jgi:hypothetical protein
MTKQEKIDEIINISDSHIKLILRAFTSFEELDNIFSQNEDDLHLMDAQFQLCLACLDLQISAKNLAINMVLENDTEANYFARIMALNCHETFNNINKLLDQPLRKYKSLPQYFRHWEMIESERRGINEYKVQVSCTVERIRHDLIAHKNGRGIVQLKKMKDIDLKLLLNIGETLDRSINSLLPVINYMFLIDKPIN